MATVTVYPTAIDFGTSTVLTLVGGIAGLSDASDATYLGVSDLDGVNGRNVQVTFQPFGLPDGLVVGIHMSARYQQVSGTGEGAPSLGLPLEGGGTVNLAMLTENYATASGPVLDVDTPPSALGSSFLEPMWTLGMSHTGAGTCDFRIYELSLTVTYADITTTPVCRLFPRDDGRGISNSPRIYPASKANRIVGGYQ